MVSQIEKWEEREKKRKKLAEERKKHQEEQRAKAQETAEPEQKEAPTSQPKNKKQNKEQPDKPTTPRPRKPKTNKGVKKMADKNWNDELKGDDTYKLAEKLGIDLSSFSADSEDSKRAQLDEIKKKIKEAENFPEGTNPTAAEQKLFDDIKNEDKKAPKNNKKRETLEVGGEEQPAPENKNWIQEKREFYAKYAQEADVVFKNDEQKDTEEKSFTFSFEKNGKTLGEMKYTSPNSVQISKESDLVMYQGLVQDALKNDLSISFGASLDNKQKALLLAAVLMSDKKTYANGDGIELKNAPQIDMNAEYFKSLPENVQAVLKDHVEKQAQQKQAEEQAQKAAEEQTPKAAEEQAPNAAALQKIKDLRAKIQAKATAEGKDIKDLTTQEYRDAMLEGLPEEQKKAHNDKMADREKILAARLGIIPEHTTVGKDGKRKVIKEDAKTKELIEKVNPQRFQELQNKYGGGRR